MRLERAAALDARICSSSNSSKRAAGRSDRAGVDTKGGEERLGGSGFLAAFSGEGFTDGEGVIAVDPEAAEELGAEFTADL